MPEYDYCVCIVWKVDAPSINCPEITSETVSALSNDAHQTGEIPSLSLYRFWCAF